jgi:hypothetical protein
MVTIASLLPLLESAEAELRVLLPQAQVPQSFHVTEIGVVAKDFFDCGGTRRAESWLQLQVWVGPDHDHRLSPQKLAGILRKGVAGGFGADLPILLECEEPEAAVPVAGLYALAQAEVEGGALVCRAAPVRTTCLAMDKCLPAHLRPGAQAAAPSAGRCGPGCC